MRQTVLRALLLLLLLTGLRPGSVVASHLLGGEMTYQYLDANGPTGNQFRYRITVFIYLNSECAVPGIPSQTVSSVPDGRCNIFLNLYNKTTGQRIVSSEGSNSFSCAQMVCGGPPQSDVQPAGTFRLPRMSNPSITPPLPGGCSIPPGSIPSVRLARYEAIVNLPVSLIGYYAVYTDGTRNFNIDNLSNPSGQNQTMYVDMAPPLLPNSSPTFSDTAVVVICQGDTSILVNNAVDPDGDRLIYSFSTPYNSLQGTTPTFTPPPPSVTYAQGYSASTPFGTGPGNYAFLNASTGISRYATSRVGRFVVAVEVKEYRTINGNEVLIGSTRREIQLVSRTCQPNNSPQFTPATVATRTFTIQEGQSLSFNLAATDPDGNPLRIRANSVLLDGTGPFNATFGGSQGTVLPGAPTGSATVQGANGSVNGQFVFNSQCGNARNTPYDVVVTATDATCGAKTVAEVFQIIVTKAAGPTGITGEGVICDRTTPRPYAATGPTANSYLWTVQGGVIQGPNTGSTVQVLWNGTGAGRITVRGISTQNCPTDSVSRTIDVRPASALTVTPTAASICQGASATLRASGGTTYTWTSSTGQTFTGSTIIVTPSATVTYTVTSTDGTCTSSQSVTVTVNPQAVADAGANATVCSGEATTLGTAALPGYTYQWSPATGLSNATAAQPSVTVSTGTMPQTLTYIVTATTAQSCVAYDTVRITVNPRPSLDSIQGSASVCPTVQGVAYSIRNAQAGDYQWIVTGGTLATGQGTAAITVNWGAASTTASVKAFRLNSFGCSSDTITFPVRVNPELFTQRPTGPLSVCLADGPFTYQTPLTAGSTYGWQIVGGTQVSTNQNTVQVTFTRAGIAKLVVTESSNPSGGRCLGQSDTLYVTVRPSPAANLAISGPSRVCAAPQSSVNFTLPGSAGSTYAWTVNGVPQASVTNTLLISTSVPSTYTITARESNASLCSGPVYTKILTVVPTLAITGPASYCPEARTGLRYTIANGTTGGVYQWAVTGGTIVSGQNSATIVVDFAAGTTPATIQANETSSTGCTAVFTVRPDNASINLTLASVDPQSDTRIALALNVPSNTGNSNSVSVTRRVLGSTGAFTAVGTAANTATTFTDTGVDADAAAYEYQVNLTNACGTVLSSTQHTTIRLQATATEGQAGRDQGKVQLTWNAYQGRPVGSYSIYRQVNGGATEELLQTVPATGAPTYSLLLPVGAAGFNQCFRIRTVDATQSTAPVSLSNLACVEFANDLVFYNIVTPNGDGLNDQFIIKNVELYSGNTFTVFNRWGKEVYKTSNYNNTFDGVNSPAGVYYYQLQLAGGRLYKGWFEVVK
ncbi:gliding motility-associated C-terminal domain-containing protein [Hymenobacter tibetensis]|uniref:Gliding motility-associated C-terminal domain-containing protein n=1 Tax=Hymenobacter tibetensis TaxID=497967 RepID=A0ABY4CTP6_9BACT|nr:gliding motility-associated C-terminal domain-containing protein [Hymenobacter tibetensis]UOG73486.1 gliding motility-associated C-terminal domain-containing protein [Hymenobacter tibetensis]